MTGPLEDLARCVAGEPVFGGSIDAVVQQAAALLPARDFLTVFAGVRPETREEWQNFAEALLVCLHDPADRIHSASYLRSVHRITDVQQRCLRLCFTDRSAAKFQFPLWPLPDELIRARRRAGEFIYLIADVAGSELQELEDELREQNPFLSRVEEVPALARRAETEHPTEFESGLIRGIAQATPPQSERFIKLHRALSRAARVLGCWSESLEAWLNDETREPDTEARRFYDQCVRVIRAGVLAEGQGNYGDEREWHYDAEFTDVEDDCDVAPPAHPRVLECRLTARGRELLASSGEEQPR